MPGTITLPQVVLDFEEEDRKRYAELKPPTTIVVRYGFMRMVAELPYDGEAKPGCGSKLVIRTRRGTEIAEMLTTTCGNGGCGKSVSRKEMLEYIENSGGKEYPFTTQGRVLRVATIDDLNEQSRLDDQKMDMIRFTKRLINQYDLAMRLVDIEVLLGGDRITFYYTSENWVDFRDVVKELAQEYQTRIEMQQVNARNEARLVADYEKCGQHCCCKQFLKVLKPISMKSAKIQKATLDPTKISGRCGRLMCCLRYEDETYDDLRKRLPRKQSRMMTDDGPGTVIDSQILTQLALIRVDSTGKMGAYPIENIRPLPREEDPQFNRPAVEESRDQRPARSGRSDGPADRPTGPSSRSGSEGRDRGPSGGGERSAGGRPDRPPSGSGRNTGEPRPKTEEASNTEGEQGSENAESARSRRPRRERKRRPEPGRPLEDGEVESKEGGVPVDPNTVPPTDGRVPGNQGPAEDESDSDDRENEGTAPDTEASEGQQGGDGTRKRRRRRRRRGGGGRPGGPAGSGEGGGPA